MARVRYMGGMCNLDSSQLIHITNFIFQTALEILRWSSEEARFPLEGRVLFTQPNDANWKKVWTVKMTSIQALLVTEHRVELEWKPF